MNLLTVLLLHYLYSTFNAKALAQSVSQSLNDINKRSTEKEMKNPAHTRAQPIHTNVGGA